MALYHPYYKNQVHVPSMSPRDSSTQVLRKRVFGVYVFKTHGGEYVTTLHRVNHSSLPYPASLTRHL